MLASEAGNRVAVHDQPSPHPAGVEPPAFRIECAGTFCIHDCDLQAETAVSQDQNRSAAKYSQRTDELARVLGIPVVKLPAVMGQSERMIFAYRSGDYPISAKAWEKLRKAEIAAGIAAEGVREEPAEYRSPPREMRINPRFAQPPADPTRGDVESYVAAYLDKACQLPGGISHAYLELREAWPMEKIERLLKNHQSP